MAVWDKWLAPVTQSNVLYNLWATNIETPTLQAVQATTLGNYLTAITTPTCTYMPEAPDENVNTAYCVCDGSITLPTQSASSGELYSDVCAYATIPTTTTFAITTAVPPVTYLDACEVAYMDDPYGVSLSPIAGCLPETPYLSMFIASTIPIQVGQITGSALYTGVSDALVSLCPPVTQTESPTICASGTIDIGEFTAISGTKEILELTTTGTGYDSNEHRDAMILSIAQTANYTAAGPNCRPVKLWEAEDGQTVSQDQETLTLCTMAGQLHANYYPWYWRKQTEPGPLATLYVTLQNKLTTADEMLCDFVEALQAAIWEELAPMIPLGDVAIDVELDKIIQISCAEPDAPDG